jgi:molybdopterin molybdotransferase
MTSTAKTLLQENPQDCCGSDNLMSVDMAIAKGLSLARPVDGFEMIGLALIRGRCLLENIVARHPLPNFNNSAMDGYAVNTQTLNGDGPYRLKITGRMAAGDADKHKTDKVPQGAIRILTGALVPDSYNAVIMQEKCTLEDGHIFFDKSPPVGNNIRPVGEDCRPGDLVLQSGTRLEPRHIAMLAAQGVSETKVRRKVRIAIFSTGSELRLPGQALSSGQIYNSNRYALAGQLDHPFIEVIDLGTIHDDYQTLKDTTQQAAEMADMIITTGGVSVGDEDHMPGIVTDLGGDLHVMKVAIKPGKPVTVGTIGNAIFLGLPGNPVAAFINQMLIGMPVIHKLAGMAPPAPATIPAFAKFERNRAPTRQEYVPAKIVAYADGSPVVETFAKAGSATLMPLANSDGFVVFPIGLSKVEMGDVVQFIPH